MVNGKVILFLGASWWGSDARSLAAALRRSGNTLIELDAERYSALGWSSFALKVLRKLARPSIVKAYNLAVSSLAQNSAIDFVVVFKGRFLKASTLEQFHLCGTPIYLFYPDISYWDHGIEIPNCLPLYDCVFTSKSQHLCDSRLRQRVRQIQLVSHAYDPEVHRKVELSNRIKQYYGCDVSFVGDWSPKKESTIKAAILGCPELELKIWGLNWAKASPCVVAKWQRRGVYGDELSIVYAASKVNLGLLSEAGTGTSAGDLVTARTWQIPAAGGFMLHEDTPELSRYFQPGVEVATYKSAEDLPARLIECCTNDKQRTEIMEAGYRRCMASHYTHDVTASTILQFHSDRS